MGLVVAASYHILIYHTSLGLKQFISTARRFYLKFGFINILDLYITVVFILLLYTFTSVILLSCTVPHLTVIMAQLYLINRTPLGVW